MSGVLDLACSVGMLACGLALASAYAARVWTAGAARDPRVERAGGSPLLGKGLMEMGYWAMRAAARACLALHVSANAISWWSLVLAALAGACFASGRYGAGAALSVASFACDALDGIVARATGSASDAGEVLDAAVDRYAELLLLGGILFHERNDALAVGLALAAIAGAVMVSYSSAKAEALGVEAPRGAMRRPERAVYLVLGTALVPVATSIAARCGAPAWTGRLPLLGCLALVGVVGNASAVRRLHAVAAAVGRRTGAAASEPLR